MSLKGSSGGARGAYFDGLCSRAVLFLVLGVVVGLTCAANEIVASRRDEEEVVFRRGAVAIVNGEPILRSDYDAELQRLQAQHDSRLTPSRMRQFAVWRLIDEELQIERGLSLELVRSDARTRKALLDAVLAAERDRLESLPFRPSDFNTFYNQVAVQLKAPTALGVRELVFDTKGRPASDAAKNRAAHDAVRRLRMGESFESVGASLGGIGPLPRVALDDLAGHIGTLNVDAIRNLAPGEVSDVLRYGTRFHVLQIMDRGIVAPQDTRDIVLRLYRAQESRRALADRLTQLRETASIQTADFLP